MEGDKITQSIALLNAATGKLGDLFWKLNQMYLDTLLSQKLPSTLKKAQNCVSKEKQIQNTRKKVQPSRKVSAYSVYFNQKKPQILSIFPDFNAAEICQMVNYLWRVAAPLQKQEYEQKAIQKSTQVQKNFEQMEKQKVEKSLKKKQASKRKKELKLKLMENKLPLKQEEDDG